MKRLCALLLVLTLLLSVCSVAAFAADDEQSPVEGDAKFYDRFEEKFSPSTMGPTAKYKEIYYHYTDPEDESTLDWALIFAYRLMTNPMVIKREIGGRLFCASDAFSPFDLCYGVYDVKKDKFMSLYDGILDSYEGLREVVQNLELESPVWEFGENKFRSFLLSLDYNATFSGYRVLSYQIGKMYNAPYEFTVNWALLKVDCEPSSAQPDTRALDITIKDKRLVAKEPTWPFGSKLAVYIPEGKDKGFHALDELDLSEYEGLEDAILSQDLEGLGIDVTEKEYLYKEKFDQYIAHYMAQTLYYDEVFYHQDQNGDTDWALISAYSNAVQPIGIFYIIGNRAIKGDNACVPFDFGCGVYDVKKNQFFDIAQVNLNDYDGLEEAFNRTKFGNLIGDIDKDNQITILDATGIQKCLASINPFPEDDFIDAPEESPIRYYSDYDRDGQRSVIDATHIQKHLAGLA